MIATELERLDAVGDWIDHSARSVADHQWTLPTPCSEWDVRALVDHVIGGNWFTVGILIGKTADQALAEAMASFAGDLDRMAVVTTSLRRQREMIGAPDVWDRQFNHIGGDLSGVDVLRLRLHDLIIHGWDLAEALDRPAVIPEVLVDWALSDLAEADSLARQYFHLDDEFVVSSDFAPQRRLLSMFGRRPAAS